MTRPYIKDFPLQVENLKEFTLDFLKKVDHGNLFNSLEGVYFTSALQIENAPDINTEDITSRSIQIFKAPPPPSRPYFIKQIISHHLKTIRPLSSNGLTQWKYR